jgi:hypothetical protein
MFLLLFVLCHYVCPSGLYICDIPAHSWQWNMYIFNWMKTGRLTNRQKHFNDTCINIQQKRKHKTIGMKNHERAYRNQMRRTLQKVVQIERQNLVWDFVKFKFSNDTVSAA